MYKCPLSLAGAMGPIKSIAIFENPNFKVLYNALLTYYFQTINIIATVFVIDHFVLIAVFQRILC